ncbi:hypothetical protein BS78_06G110700 [Paspalum vaginatum]|nr:hypothetical protein BS78_06G110700 [Paspalum vaginatum]
MEEVISAVGSVSCDEVVDQVKDLFTEFSTDPTAADQLIEANPAIFISSEVCVERAEMPHVASAFKGSSWTNPSFIPLMVIQSILGSWHRSGGIGDSSWSSLARGISNDNLGEAIKAFNTNYWDTGIFGIYTISLSNNRPLSCSSTVKAKCNEGQDPIYVSYMDSDPVKIAVDSMDCGEVQERKL